MPAFQPYWGKPAVRNDREDRGNVGIIRSPVRASIPPDPTRHDRSILLRQTNAVEGQIIHDPANALAAAAPSDTKLRG